MTQTPPGWYQTADGSTRWWDGAAWAAPAQPAPAQSNAKGLAILAHIGPPAGLSIFAPIITLVAMKDTDPNAAWTRHHAIESLNFNITFLFVYIALFFATFVLGFLTLGLALIVLIPVLIAVTIAGLIVSVLATVAASRGEWYRYPVSIRMIS